MQRYLKFSRVVISVMMLVVITFVFVDFRGSLPAVWYHCATWLQFAPSLIKFLQTLAHGLAVTAWGFVAVLLLTLLFGRVYCSYICPLGVFQDVISWFSKKTRSSRKKRIRFRYARPKTWLRYSLLVVFCLSLFAGGVFLDLLEPFSNFGRFASSLLRPLYMLGNNVLVKALEAIGSYALYPVAVAKTDPYALIVPVSMLALVIWLSVWKGRLYCNSVCPVGTLLGLVSKASLFKIRFEDEGCNQCGNCVFSCKSQCIDLKNREVDFNRCVGCGNCIKVCDKNAIRYSLSPSKKPKLSDYTDESKRKFVTQSLLFVSTLGGFSVNALARDRKRNRIRERGDETYARKLVKEHAVTPPGSHAYEHFTKSCTACHLCVSACPTGVLKPSFLEYGFFGMMQPFMDYHASFCNYECVRCTEVCPSGAILPLTVEEKLTTQIGVVRFMRGKCIVVTDETSCGSCAEHCPTKAVRMIPYKGELTIPEITPDICVGCGACEYACPVTPYKAITVDGLPEHQTAQKPEKEKLKEKPMEEFPF